MQPRRIVGGASAMPTAWVTFDLAMPPSSGQAPAHRGVEIFLGWRQHFGAKIQCGTAHIVVIDFKSPTFISNLESIIYFVDGKPCGCMGAT